MEDKIKEVKVEFGPGEATLQDGSKKPVEIKTTYTIWESKRQDCHVEILTPLDIKPIADL